MTWLVIGVIAAILGSAVVIAWVVSFAIHVHERDEIDEGY